MFLVFIYKNISSKNIYDLVNIVLRLKNAQPQAYTKCVIMSRVIGIYSVECSLLSITYSAKTPIPVFFFQANKNSIWKTYLKIHWRHFLEISEYQATPSQKFYILTII